MNHQAILPGATLGMIGGGQLGRMFIAAARRMGYRVHVLAPGPDDPAMQAADEKTVAPYDDLDAVERLARNVRAVSFEFENVPAAATECAARFVPVRPAGAILSTAQNRLREKGFLDRHGFPVARHEAIDAPGKLDQALEKLAAPAIFKTAAWGYDGRGQIAIKDDNDRAEARRALEEGPGILEARVDFEAECSVIVTRGIDGRAEAFGPVRNAHSRHILDVSTVPAGFDESVASDARRIARAVAEALELVGVLCVEFFVLPSGKLLVNELAPRPHNSGHLTIEACQVSQFEQQVRVVCGLAPGRMELLRPAAMANLLGDLWANGEPDWPAALSTPGVRLHLYGKAEARPGRKMGHLTALADSAEEARRRVLEARSRLSKTADRP